MPTSTPRFASKVSHELNFAVFNSSSEWRIRIYVLLDEYIDSGGNIEFVVADTLSHFKPCDYVPYLQEAAVWLQDEVWE